MTIRVACVGRRDITPKQREVLAGIGEALVRAGVMIVSGNAAGSDQAYAAGANRVDAGLVELWVPWRSFEARAQRPGNRVREVSERRHFEEAAAHHPAWAQLSQGAQKLFARNVAVVEGVDVVVAFPNTERRGDGGTGHAVRVAKGRGIPVVDLARGVGLERLRALSGAAVIPGWVA